MVLILQAHRSKLNLLTQEFNFVVPLSWSRRSKGVLLHPPSSPEVAALTQCCVYMGPDFDSFTGLPSWAAALALANMCWGTWPGVVLSLLVVDLSRFFRYLPSHLSDQEKR